MRKDEIFRASAWAGGEGHWDLLLLWSGLIMIEDAAADILRNAYSFCLTFMDQLNRTGVTE